ncbi:MAG TPA: TIM barrel protein, partial [Limnobacter sp.]|nr:TIM barrel protein [Limnobacter sp.]
SWLYTELPFLQRVRACAEDGFRHAECMFPYEFKATELRRTADSEGVQWVLINAPAGHWEHGDRGLAADAGRRQEFRDAICMARDFALELKVGKVHVLAGLLPAGESNSSDSAWACYEDNLAWLAETMAEHPIRWLIEPINQFDMPGYLLSSQKTAHDLVQRLNKPNLGVQMDLYHCQRTEGDALDALARYVPTGRVGHLQIAGVPHRNEPDSAETPPGGLDYGLVFRQLQHLGYDGHIGCEYRPKGSTRDGLGWLRRTGFSGTMEGLKPWA